MALEELFKDGEILKDKIIEEFAELNARAASLTFFNLSGDSALIGILHCFITSVWQTAFT